ncbi:TIGR03745 family integrating conjugative element membrane protein [Pectobacteriaceae bacterium CE70]|uniref:TIGR03745 family integrating conjugative element membrane protein n=1 Tax=Serratia sp. (strain ATCC 39006) TaxID=104623 RepID=A0A2I5TBE7_SERS3|nr:MULTISPECIES: TIGR03745 family integrating conjugative element membrane protein [Enterobacterales]WJV59221.1 TIGR03745 family integrating conjugative element membrane protein [Pectobacteriaceae bacterium C111]WJV63491.1 TIGR03745 family integrating conjugative element membrane protein [Pectobacteriaceae bacterium C52]WJV67873.1 TIGR03745 family integrating conjugative element membrane protein [Pectobacteriaceae bacterium CE70]WJY11816.1 TIGR03745 family integrating conjugative element membra
MKLMTFFRNRFALLAGSTLFYVGNALADLPSIEQPTSGGGSGTYATIKGYLRDGLTLGGLVIAAVAFIVVANAAISCFHHVRQGKATWTEFGTFVIIGVILLVVVIWLVTKASDIL